MDHHSEQTTPVLTAGLNTLLSELRQREGFSPAAYVQAKARRLNEYFAQSGLKSCVVAVSGGLDSALVLALVAAAARQEDSPILRIVPVMLPVFDADAATHQDVATARAQELCMTLSLAPIVIDLSEAHSTTRRVVERALHMQGEGWAAGQLVAYQRTPAYYYVTSLLREAGTPGVVVGTTNRDEGAYLGYFGKASDGMVDLQLISDLYKSQVHATAEYLGVPKNILQAVPTGDMYDGRTDEQVFGASYDAVELFLRAKTDLSVTARILQLPGDDLARFALLAERLEALHRFNHHKYLGKSPAVHFDLWNCQIPGGWDYYVYPGADAAR